MKVILGKLLLILVISCGMHAAPVAPSGSGTSGDPYQIATLDNLQWLSEKTDANAWDTGKYYVQAADIDAAATSSWNSGEGFSPIGNLTTRFFANYDGQNYTISNLYINRTGGLQQGLFGWIQNNTINNIILKDALVTVNK